MKKAVALFMVLIACVCAVFAADSDDVTVKALVDGKTSVAFTTSPYLDSSSELIQGGFSAGIDLGDITAGNTFSNYFYVSAKTNEAVALEMKLYGTALTLKEEDGLVSDASIEDGNAIKLNVEVVTVPTDDGTVVNSGITDKNEVSFTVAATSGSSAPTEGDQFITFTEGATSAGGSGDPGTGTRALTWTLRASADGSQAQAGSYEAYLTLDLTNKG